MMTRYEPKSNPDGRKVSRRLREETIITSDGTTERLELEERDQEEYYYVNSRAQTPVRRRSSLDSNTVTVNFPNDDRLLNTTTVCYKFFLFSTYGSLELYLLKHFYHQAFLT
ncbi:unnamed protein product [Enterobius vermicularis]|uniref:TEN1 n=1 Tax=Enterobius vermicularis TaxID=51028 RepID=A0A0N4V358_ENTVE|nr:unnamed protein product [Enterobius vermicularis]